MSTTAVTKKKDDKPLIDKNGNILVPFNTWPLETKVKYVEIMRENLLSNLSAAKPKPIDFDDPLFKDVYLKGWTPSTTKRDEIELALIVRYLLLTRGEPRYDASGALLQYSEAMDLHRVNGAWMINRNGAMQNLMFEDDGKKDQDERGVATTERVQAEFSKVLLLGNPHLLTSQELKKLSTTTGWDKILPAYLMLPKVQLHGEVYEEVTLEAVRTPKAQLNMGAGFYDYERGILNLHKVKFREHQWLSTLIHDEPSHQSSTNYTEVVPDLKFLQAFKQAEIRQLRKRFFDREFIEEWVFNEQFADTWKIFLNRFSNEDEAIYFLFYIAATLTRGVKKLGLFVIGQPNTGKTALIRLLRHTLQNNVRSADSDCFVKDDFGTYNNKLLPFSESPLVFVDELPRDKKIDDVAFKTIVNDEPQSMTIKTKFMSDRLVTMIGKPVIFSNHTLKVDALGVAERSQLVNCDVQINKESEWNFDFDRDYASQATNLLTLLIIMGRCWYYNRFIGESKNGHVDILSWYETDTMEKYQKQMVENDKPIIEFFKTKLDYDDTMPGYKAIKFRVAYQMYATFCTDELGMKNAPTRQQFADDMCEFVLQTTYQKYKNNPDSTSANVLIVPHYCVRRSNNSDPKSNNATV